MNKHTIIKILDLAGHPATMEAEALAAVRRARSILHANSMTFEKLITSAHAGPAAQPTLRQETVGVEDAEDDPDLRDEIADLMEELEEAEANLDDVHSRLGEAEERVQSLENDLTRAQETQARLTAELHRYRTLLDRANHDREKLTRSCMRVEELEERLEKARALKRRYREEAKCRLEANEALQRENDKLQRQCETLRGKAHRASGNLRSRTRKSK